TEDESRALAAFELTPFLNRAEDLAAAQRTVSELARRLGWPTLDLTTADGSDGTEPDQPLRAYLYTHLHGFGPVELLIERTAGNAVSFVDLARATFPAVNEQTAGTATSVLLALGTY